MPIRLDVVAVDRTVYSDDVDMVIAPGIEGEMGILPRHAPLMTALNYGILVVKKTGEPDEQIAIGGGFMEVRPDRVTVLADFISTEPANDSSEMFSSAAIVWFQEEFGLPDEGAIRQLRKLDWKSIARDWSW